MKVILTLLFLGKIYSFVSVHRKVLHRAITMANTETVISYAERTKQLRNILNSDEITIMPCCYDGLTARLVEQAGKL